MFTILEPLIKSSNLFLWLFFSLLFIACHEQSNEDEIIGVNSAKDSIALWIKEGRKKTNTIKDRKYFLNKALTQSKLEQNDSLKMKHFSKIQWSYLNLKDSTSFRTSNKLTANFATQIKDSSALAGSYWDLALFLHRKRVKDSAYYYYGKAQKIYLQIKKPVKSGQMYIYMANIQNEIKDYVGSEVNSINAIRILKPENDFFHLYSSYNLLGIARKDMKDYDGALVYYNNANNYLNKVDKKRTKQPSLNNNIGVVYNEKGAYSEAIPYFLKALEFDSLIFKNKRLYAKALNNLAYSRSKLNIIKIAESGFKRSLEIRTEIEDFEGMSGSYFNLAEFYSNQKDTVNALYFAKNAITYSNKSSNYERLLETLLLLSEIDPKNASKYSKSYADLSERLQDEERNIKEKFTRIEFETEEVIARNALLARQRLMLIGIAIGLFLLAVAAFTIIMQRVKNQKLKFQQQQQESNQEIFDLMLAQKKKVEEGKQLEQKRISEELHDSVVGQMHSVRMLLLGLNKKADETAITLRQDAIEKLKEVQEEVRTISHELNDAAYQKIYNFISSIEDLLKGFQNTEGILAGFEYDDDTDWDQLSGEVKINLYRVIQESLQNCAKHANAKNVSLSLNTNNEGIIATLVDDGVGFDVRKGKKGIGLKNIQSRIQKINGTWGVTSQSGKGTTVQIQVPSIDIRKVEEINLESEQQEA